MSKSFLIIIFSTFLIHFSFCQSVKVDLQNCVREYSDLGDFEGAIEQLSTLIQLFPNDTNAYMDRGILKDVIADYDGAVADFSKGIELDSTNTDNFYLRGISYYKKKDFESSLSDFNKGLSAENDNADMHYYRGMTLLNLKKYLEAINDFDFALKSNSDFSSDILANRAFSKLQLKKNNEAFSDLNSAIAANNENSFAYYLRGTINADMNNYKMALDDFLKLISQNNDEFFELKGYALSKNNIKNFSKEIHDFFSQSILSNNDESDICMKGRLFEFVQLHDSAISYYNKAISLNPNFSNAYYLRGIANWKHNKPTEAKTDLTKSIELNPKSAKYHLRRAEYFFSISNNVSACEDIYTYKKLGNYYYSNSLCK